jgi:hypothetical protein
MGDSNLQLERPSATQANYGISTKTPDQSPHSGSCKPRPSKEIRYVESSHHDSGEHHCAWPHRNKVSSRACRQLPLIGSPKTEQLAAQFARHAAWGEVI